MKEIMKVHHNEWIWGETWTFVGQGGNSLLTAKLWKYNGYEDQENAIDPSTYYFLESFSVVQEERGKGIGTRLLQEAVDYLQSRKKLDIILQVENKEELYRFYGKRGFLFLHQCEDENYSFLIYPANEKYSRN